MYQVILKRHEEKKIKAGQDRVYANEVYLVEGKGKNGELAAVYDFQRNFLGKGFINHLSKILVTIFLRDEDAEFTQELVAERLRFADESRKRLGFSGAYRAFFGSADGIPGLVVDRYGDYLSVQLQSLGLQKNKPLIADALQEVFHPLGIWERSDSAVMEKEGLTPINGCLCGEFSPVVTIEENQLRLQIDLQKGQKTGYFLDQKQNRLAARAYANEGTVLDCFCNAGGFALNAAAAGAEKVYALDISADACADVARNADLNGLSEIVTPICCDVFEELRKYRAQGLQFDTIILDPPAFCKSVSEVGDAIRGYKDINILGMKLVKKGGFLISSSCTHFVSRVAFEEMLKQSSLESGRRAKIVEVRTQSADHAALLSADENTYLKFYVLQMMD